jgi:hypothetical protein
MTYRSIILLLPAICLVSLSAGVSSVCAMDPRFELDPATLEKNIQPKTIPPLPTREEAAPGPLSGETSYTVKRGDTLNGLLMRNFGMDRKRARALIPEIKRRNRLNNAGRLSVGEKIIIPLRHAKNLKRGAKSIARAARPKSRFQAGSVAAAHRLSLFKTSPGTAGEEVTVARSVWGKLIPEKISGSLTYAIKGNNFSLDLDPGRFPVFPTVSGGKIVVEAGGRLSPLVRSLIEQNDPGTRFVTYSPDSGKKFLNDLLAAAGFYSVEENFSVSFGNDPKLTVSADFKVENDSDSPLQHDIFLFNTDKQKGGFPPVLVTYLADQGFRFLDISPPGKGEKPGRAGVIDIISEKDPSALADRLLSVLNLNYERNREVDLLNMGEGGVGLKVKVERYFEKNGERYVVGIFRGDPVNYTLLRLLESMHYHVVMLTPEDDFRSVINNLFSQLHIPSQYAMQDMLPAAAGLPYSINMSGILVNTPNEPGMLFLTETRPDPVISDLLELNGYSIREGHEDLVRK